jgi:hypothetical protein
LEKIRKLVARKNGDHNSSLKVVRSRLEADIIQKKTVRFPGARSQFSQAQGIETSPVIEVQAIHTSDFVRPQAVSLKLSTGLLKF